MFRIRMADGSKAIRGNRKLIPVSLVRPRGGWKVILVFSSIRVSLRVLIDLVHNDLTRNFHLII